MPQMIGLARLGRDAELRDTKAGTVAGLSLAFTYGRKDDEGQRPTQWVDASLWGDRADALAPYLVKGQLLYVCLDDAHIETYEGKNGPGAKIVARVATVEFAGPPPEDKGSREGQRSQSSSRRPEPERQSSRQAPRQAPARSQKPSTGFDDMDDDIPF